ncbi:MAG: tyrosine-type recombinase/integrase [Clostridia bacterium]|nr:tyrosine-type recombinase/integrase [Clostridia bacterium]
MATIEKRRNKAGKVISYRITVAGGIDTTGKQIRHRMTWKPDAKMTARQIDKALARAAADFERQIEQGYQLDNRQTFAEYTDYVIALKERTGLKKRTIDRYRELKVRVDLAIGHMKLIDIRPQHLNSFYENLSEQGIRMNTNSAKARIDLNALLKENHLSYAACAKLSAVSAPTVSAAANGKSIRLSSADKIAATLGISTTSLFTLEQDSKPLEPRTILEYHCFISGVLSQAEKELLIPYNPASKATPPKVEKKEVVYYQPDQLARILNALEDAPLKWKTFTYLLIDTGCRRGEIAGLKWKSIDLHSGIITIERALLYSTARGTYEDTTKNRKSRTLHLAPETITLLKQHKASQLEMQLANGDRWNDTGFVFTQDNGLPICPTSATHWLDDFAKAHDLPHIHPHAFRHTAASLMIAQGVDLVTTANELGHSSAMVTANVYAHQIEEAKAKASNARASVFSRQLQA